VPKGIASDKKILAEAAKAADWSPENLYYAPELFAINCIISPII